MDKDIVLLDLFSGIGGFSKGLEDGGFNILKHYYSEVDKYAIANYKYNFYKSIYAGDVINVGRGTIERPNIITFGSPCQDFSLAGKRAGMEGQRSSLIGEAIRIITELRPDVFIWENVKGVFSSNSGADFWAIIQAFTNIGGYRLEWQLLNTAWVLPQNRERIYLIGHLAETGGRFIFPITEINGRTTERTTEATVNTLTAGGHSGGMHSSMTLIRHRSDQPYKQADCSPTIRNSDKAEIRIVASRDRNPNNPSDRTNGSPTEQRLEINEQGITNTLTNIQKDNYLLKDDSIRRLTEIECERLQGFPDNWTEYGNYEVMIKKIPKTQRYKMLGNAVTVKIVELIAKRLLL